MSTFFKILLGVVIVVALLHFWPAVLGAFLLGGLVLFLIALFGGAGVSVLAGLVLLLVGAVLLVLCIVSAVLSPLWIPLLLIVGLVAMFRGLARGSS